MFSLVLLRMSEEIRVGVMVHLLGVWINITAVLSAVWEHNTLVGFFFFFTKTPRSNNRGRFVSTRAPCDVVVDSFSVFFFFLISIVSSGHLPPIIFAGLQISEACRRDRKERIVSWFDERPWVWSLTDSWGRFGTRQGMAGVRRCQMRRFTFDGWFQFWQPRFGLSLPWWAWSLASFVFFLRPSTYMFTSSVDMN